MAGRSGILRFFCIALGLLDLAGCAEPGEPLLTRHAGYEVYRRTCRRCHGNGGNGARASRMADRTVDLGAPAFRDTVDAAEIEGVIRTGKGRMKGYAEKLDRSEIEAVASYILALPEARRATGAP